VVTTLAKSKLKGNIMNIVKITAIVAVALTLAACAEKEVEQEMVTEDTMSSKL
jgi:hypothetical protein